MKVTLVLLAAAAAVMAQSNDTFSTTQAATCEPHGDHWHCPSGVPKPTTPPASVITSVSQSHDNDGHDHDHAVSATTCQPHGDHWHCPSGVPKPTTKPAASTTAGNSTSAAITPTGNSTSAARTSASPSSTQFPGAAAKVGSGALAIVGAVGAWLL